MSQDKLLRQQIKQQDHGTQSDEEELLQQEEKLNNDLKAKRRLNRLNSKLVVGSGFSFDITDFFKFQKKAKYKGGVQSIFDEISGGHLSWFILLYSVCNSALIPPWIMSIKANKLLRISWRFLLQTLMIIPFVLYERRIGDASVRQKYTFKHILAPENLKKLYLSSFSTSFWFTCILTCFQWSYISHIMVLGGLSNFFLSIGRTFRKSSHDLQPGGQVLVILGIILTLLDAFTLDPEEASAEQWNVINPFYLSRSTLQRILSDLCALLVSYCMSKLSVYTSDIKNYYPPYLSMLIINLMVCFNMMFSGFFFNGATFDFQSFHGIFSIFSQTHFGGFMYMSIILCMGMFLSFVMVSKLFPDPIIPALAMVFEPIVSTLILNLVGIQGLPGPFACIGYIFIVPGVFLILIGQCMFQRTQKKQQQVEKKRISKIKQVLETKRLKKSLSLKQIPQQQSMKKMQTQQKLPPDSPYQQQQKKKSKKVISIESDFKDTQFGQIKQLVELSKRQSKK